VPKDPSAAVFVPANLAPALWLVGQERQGKVAVVAVAGWVGIHVPGVVVGSRAGFHTVTARGHGIGYSG